MGSINVLRTQIGNWRPVIDEGSVRDGLLGCMGVLRFEGFTEHDPELRALLQQLSSVLWVDKPHVLLVQLLCLAPPSPSLVFSFGQMVIESLPLTRWPLSMVSVGNKQALIVIDCLQASEKTSESWSSLLSRFSVGVDTSVVLHRIADENVILQWSGMRSRHWGSLQLVFQKFETSPLFWSALTQLAGEDRQGWTPFVRSIVHNFQSFRNDFGLYCRDGRNSPWGGYRMTKRQPDGETISMYAEGWIAEGLHTHEDWEMQPIS